MTKNAPWNYWNFDYVESLTEKQNRFIKAYRPPEWTKEKHPIVEKKQEKKPRKKIDQNIYIKITQEEIEKQFQEAMSQMKSNPPEWRENNIQANKLPVA